MTLRLLLLLALLFSFYSPFCLAQDINYSISAAQLTTLESNLNELRSINKMLSDELILSKNELIQVRKELATYQIELKEVRSELLQSNNELKLAKQDLTAAKNSLNQANQSLKQYEAEVQREIKSLQVQRVGLLVGLVYFMVK